MSRSIARSVAERILARASRPGGASRHELTSYAFDQLQRPEARKRIEEMISDGRLFRFTRPPKGGRGQSAQQFFANRAHGEYWAGLVAETPRKPPKPPSTYVAIPLTVSDRRSRAVALAAEAPAVVPPGLKPQVLPSAPVYARHQLPPGAVVPAVVSSSECRPWALNVGATR